MTDLMQPDEIISARWGQRQKPSRMRRAASFSPASPATPKELFVEIRSMAGGDYLTANLSRAVVQIVRQSGVNRWQYEVDDFVEMEGGWQIESTERESDPDAPPITNRIQDQLTGRLASLLRDAEHEGKLQDVIESFGKLVAAEIAVKGKQSSFINHAKRLDQLGQTDTALDIIFDQIDEMLLSNEFSRVDRLLMEISPGDFSVDLLLGVLTATLPAKNRLSNRRAFFERVNRSLHDRGIAEDGLLVGLD